MPNPYTGDPKAYDPEKDFNGELQGSCLCGSINVTIKDPDLFTKPRGFLCHCSNCRKVAGSVYSTNIVIEADRVTIKDRDHTLKAYQDYATGSGKPVTRSFCSTCGNPVKSETPLYRGKVIVKTGMFPRIPAPEAESFSLHRHPWQAKHEDVKMYNVKLFGDPYMEN